MVMIKNNEKALLYLLRHFRRLSKMELTKRSFLVSQANNIYDYVPYKYGPFSFQLYDDLKHLEKNNFVKIDGETVEISNDEFPEPDISIRRALNYHISQYGEWNNSQIREFVYNKYPFFTIYSEIEKKMEYKPDEKGIITIGYEGKSVDKFLFELVQNKVNVLIDVRKNAYSMKYGFSKSQISRNVNKLNIEYLHIPNLGIESSKRKNFLNMRLSYPIKQRNLMKSKD